MAAFRSYLIHGSLLALLGLTATTTVAQSVKDAYVQDARGVIVRNSNFGDPKIGNLCWRTGYWTPALAIAECDPDIAPRPAAPPPPAPAAAPAPAMKPAAPKPAPAAPRKCDFVETLGADETFEFNKSVLRASAKTHLDAVAAKAAGCAKVNLLLVTGHTDRIGSVDYNMKLSELRAAAVAGYLGSKGLSGAQIAGVGKTMPIKSCDDKLPRKMLIDCLAPNRRVVVDVQGPAK
jgi:OOP family OmpA-OmpF porin